MLRYHFEDLVPGLTLAGGPIAVTREDIIGFARAFDPQPFHLDEEAARDSLLGGLIASGWHSCALGMRLIAESLILKANAMGSPGIDEVRWLRPVRPGDTLSSRLTVRESRPSVSKPDRGFVRLRLDLANGAGETVMIQDCWVMFGRRGAAPLPPRAVPPAPDAPADAADPLTAFPAGPVETLEVGATYDLGSYRFAREEILRFARAFDPQPFHLDEAAARASHFGGLCASGWHTAAAWMNRMVAARERGVAAARERGEPVAASGPSPGFRDLKWLKPVYAGDTIRYAATITEARPSRSRPGWGLVGHTATGVNQHGDTVFSFRGAWLAEARAGR
ncbi:MaoC family dehydratase [Methylobacterium nodulans]|uniref:MaoC domain protein dehydratase n=1 Tax=Methylobacterium nodulans (strain LMG 21967 / CNCM I-2342 / ORS 2060) TaxID=460265 RepID=B8IFN1_METNO|nr:MaoC family dehydratase [Methylobacterium nodulans]ACL57766.1 MaoC domain protein dehydratase [Methylobacterium nodulans ORS 2060]